MKQETQATIHPLAQFAATLQWSDVPEPVQRRAEDLWVDWFGSVLAGCKARPVASITRFALSQGPAQGPSEVIAHGATSSPMMAALANAAASRRAQRLGVPPGGGGLPASVGRGAKHWRQRR
jgi:2-methylcitrate dehydratase PrpD